MTGNWGCGAFGGDPQLKAMLQWIAASQVVHSPWTFSCICMREVLAHARRHRALAFHLLGDNVLGKSRRILFFSTFETHRSFKA